MPNKVCDGKTEDPEKSRQNLQPCSSVAFDEDAALLHPEVRKLAEKKLVRKLDGRLLPTVAVIFVMNYIDRTAVTTARLKGLEKDLGLTSIQYSTILAILYASYVPAQIPSNMFLNWISKPSLYIPLCVILWGTVSALTGVTHNFAGLAACRVFLGLPEAAFYPGAIYLCSRWYTKRELAFRCSILYVGLLVSNAFGSLMAAGILSRMDGKRGIHAWRWLFYIEGCITIAIGFMAIILLPDYPHNTHWLSPAEQRLAQVRLAEDAGEADEDVNESPLAGLKMAIHDPKVSMFAVISFCQLLGQSFINFFPTLTATLGFGTTASLLLAAPPWILAAVVCCVNAWHADKTGERFFHNVVPQWVTIIGYIIGISTLATVPRYVSMFMMTLGYAGFALTLVWIANVIPRPPAKRSAAIAIVNGFGNLGNLTGSYVWKASWAPMYRPSMIIGLVSLVFSTFLSFLIRRMLVRQNKQLDSEQVSEITEAGEKRIEDAARLEGISVEEAVNKRRGFRYLY